ncbi:DUF2309 domain-containing protein [Mycolicibacterium arenosum]|uniref:Probable inorganic carbon transporter subunit DabA n=1 Tax=Mycolicibacterium arenosum TaxID=2952157 RepID=A0ABT1M4H0_9MYCO|nr:DUF2309 domain-containing protein [Mycolicibacterium sp. CAU 1645]MCP9273134.1 DUF2309 domain-containing protein [Mycolicibacterium sp. CAU 1645]
MTESTLIPPDHRRARLRSDIRLAGRLLPTHYPLGTFIAVNPLAGLQTMPFEQAIRRAGDLYGTLGTLPESTFRSLYRQGRITDTDLDSALIRRYPILADEPDLRLAERTFTAIELLRADLLFGHISPDPIRRSRIRAEQLAPHVADNIDAHAAKWSAAFFGQASWPMPGRELGFYAAWRTLAPGDRSLPRTARKALRAVAERSDDAALEALDALGVADDARITYLQAHLTRLPGWAAHVQWSADRGVGIDLLQYLAMRLSYEAALLRHHSGHSAKTSPQPTPPTARERAEHLLRVWGVTEATDGDVTTAARILAAVPIPARLMLWQNAFESHYHDQLLSDLEAHRPPTDPPAHTHLVTCIDTRSEGLRRHLEACRGYQTFGFAGFFAVAIRFTDLLNGAPADLCPVLISPSHDITEQPAPHAHGTAVRQVTGTGNLAGAESAFHSAKESVAAPFALAEAAGWIAAPLAAAKTLAPAAVGNLRRRLRDAIAPPAESLLNVNAMSLAERVLFAQVTLTTIGLTRDFGRLIVLCAHHSTTENNPYQASLDCGACGGQGGGPNARTAARILNQTEVRDELRSAGIDISEHTHVLAALHDTATDRITILDAHLIPTSHSADVDRLRADLGRAGRALAAERCATLPGAKTTSPRAAARHVLRRAVDWAQVYPEWALAGNAAFVIAPRELTRDVDLQRRTFLHSYDATLDADGTALETILTAPLVVAQWINCQYYFSAVAPDVFGAGTKTVHNVVGNAGVIAGHVGDLRLGLPWQSVGHRDRLVHEPQRLLAIVQAPLERIDAVIDRNTILQQMFGNDWVFLAAREHPTEPWQRWTRDGWQLWPQSRCRETVHNKEMIS